MSKSIPQKLGFRYDRDVLPVSIVAFVFLSQLFLFFLCNDWKLVLIGEAILLVPQMSLSAFNHHHAHLNTFKPGLLNFLLNTVLALETGIVNMGWVLHHNLGHHKNYLNQTKDQSRWMWKSGNTMSLAGYLFSNYIRMIPEMVRVARGRGDLMKRFVLQMTWTLFIVTIFILINPINALILFVGPMLLKPMLTFLATYFQHAGLHSTDDEHASYNHLNPSYNAFFWNLGYHTAHHMKPGLHWSVLPEYHKEIAAKIPDELKLTDAQPWVMIDRLLLSGR